MAVIEGMSEPNPSTAIKVWDPLVRVLHWGLATAFAVAYATGEEIMSVHEVAGYAILVIVSLRLVWGFIGTPYARFADFVRGPGAVRGYLKSLVAGHPEHYVGHNPAGGWMIMALLGGVAVTAVTGILADQSGVSHGTFEELHEVAANGMLLLVLGHIAGVIVGSLAHRENLVRAMITGRKKG